jgi:putative NADPH-quinone reductase
VTRNPIRLIGLRRPEEAPMKALTIYAHPDPDSFCHGVLERFTTGLRDAGHASEVLDLYAAGFDPGPGA